MNPDGLNEEQVRELADYFGCLLAEHSIIESTRAVEQLWPLVLDAPEPFGPLVL
jgi:hypothetical protein